MMEVFCRGGVFYVFVTIRNRCLVAQADAADLRLNGQDTKTAATRFALQQTGRLRVRGYEKSDASGLRPIYKV